MKWEYQGSWVHIVVEIFRPIAEIRKYRVVAPCRTGRTQRRLARTISRRMRQPGRASP